MKYLSIFTLVLISFTSQQNAYSMLKSCCTGHDYCKEQGSCTVAECCALLPGGNPGGNGGSMEGMNCGNIENGTHCKMPSNIIAIQAPTPVVRCKTLPIPVSGIATYNTAPACETISDKTACEAKKNSRNQPQCSWNGSISPINRKN